MTRKTWIIFIAICVAILGWLIWSSQQTKTDVSQVDTSAVRKSSDDKKEIGDNIFGNANSKVMIIEYGDFQCPGCASAAPVIKNVATKYKDKIGLVFRNFPLATIHPNARAAAAAAEAAGLQGKYWELHDELYAKQQEWSMLTGDERTKQFEVYAREVGLNLEKWNTDLTSPKVDAKISYDMALGKKAKVTGTPTIFIGDKQVDQYVKDDKIVSKDTEDARPIWSDEEAFEKLILIPAMREAGIKTD